MDELVLQWSKGNSRQNVLFETTSLSAGKCTIDNNQGSRAIS